jgi:glutathionylspermidine synthase
MPAFGEPLGVTLRGVVSYSCGDHRPSTRESARSVDGGYVTGAKWDALEFARRFVVMSKGAMLPDLPTATNLFDLQKAPYLGPGGGAAPLSPCDNGAAPTKPETGDLIVWDRSEAFPFGHCAVVVAVEAGTVRIAEQGVPGASKWPEGRPFARELHLKALNGLYYVTEDAADTTGGSILGWLHVMWPDINIAEFDLPDLFRQPLSSGAMERHPIERDLSMPWINRADRCGFFLRRSLVAEGHAEASHPEEVPSAFYTVDYDLWQRVRTASTELHTAFVDAAKTVINDVDNADKLTDIFGIPPALHAQLRASLAYPCFMGRFDLGYDGSKLSVLEYNCDSSAAILETAETQQQIAKHYGFDKFGTSSGAGMQEQMTNYWRELLNSPLCPPTKVVHFMVDDDDEEKYTALIVMRCAEEAGFRCKLCVKLVDFQFAQDEADAKAGRGPRVVDLDRTPVLMVWKTWSWSTIVGDFEKQEKLREAHRARGSAAAAAGETASSASSNAGSSATGGSASTPKPTLSDVLLCHHTVVLEPFWKAIAGSKGLLPYVYETAPTQPNMLPSFFHLDASLEAKGAFVKKPVRGRGGMNVTIHDGGGDGSTPVSTTTGGAFGDDVVVFQGKCNLKRFDDYYPIFGAWVVGAHFVGAAVREDRSRVTSLASCVAPVRVIREGSMPPKDVMSSAAAEA